MRRLRTLLTTILTAGLTAGIIVVPASADTQVVSTFDGSYATEASLSGFTTQSSLLPGESLTLKVRATNAWSVKIIRIGSYSGGDGKLIETSASQSPSNQPDCTTTPDTHMVECAWSESISFASNSWESGLYVARLESSDGYAIAPFVVRAANPAGRTLVNVGFLTMQAYNRFGGSSAYRGSDDTPVNKSQVVSFDRPIDSVWALSHFRRYEVTVAQSVDRNVPNASWTTGIDIHSGATSLAGVTSIVTSGHDEYWTVEQRWALENALKAGTNLFVTGGNSLFWRVRPQNSNYGINRQIAIYKDPLSDPLQNAFDTTTRWRQNPLRNPEAKISGTMYNNWHDVCLEEPNDWIVTDPKWWGYNNTGVVAGSRIPGLVGREVDQIIKKYSIPKNTRVVAHGSYVCDSTGVPVTKLHDSTFITLKSGASIFATGSQMWPCAMNGNCVGEGTNDVTNAFTRTVSDNVIQVFNAGKVKKSWRAKNNLKKVYGKAKFKYYNPKKW